MSTKDKFTHFTQDFPAFPLGTYQVEVKHDISGTSIPSGTTYQKNHTFEVKSSRYGLDSDAVLQVYPVNNEQYAPAGMLPHAVFKHHTLPWQRKLFSQQQTSTAPLGEHLPSLQQINDFAPWMGVLLFEDSENIAAPINRKVSKFELDPNILTHPFLPDNEAIKDQTYQTIDIPIALFNQIAPSGADLYYMAHARGIDPTNKPIGIGGTPLEETSALMGNRVPVQGVHSSAHLVSFEQMYDYLPSSVDYSPSVKIPTTATTIRLIVYKSWKFYTEIQHKPFDAYFKKLDYGGDSAGLQIPSTIANKVKEASIKNALNLGYVPLNHHSRMGAETVSWYRGPLLPFQNNPEDAHLLPSGVTHNPDLLLRFNPDSGLYDTSYAAAWQLGQLLILQNKKAATSLYDWKKAITKAALDQQAKDAYKKANPSIASKIFKKSDSQVEGVATNAVAPIISQLT